MTDAGWQLRLRLPDTYTWAWRKVRGFLTTGDVWFDEVALIEFELNLPLHIQQIREQLLDGSYTMQAIALSAQPKGPLAKPAARQTFTISLRDQLAWSALLIAIGPRLDLEMPSWSLGGRLYRAMVRESLADPWREGPFRHTRGLTYRSFSQSWSLYRRFAFLTVRRMAFRNADAFRDLDEGTQSVFDSNQSQHNTRQLPYLSAGYWKKPCDQVFYASLDFSKFYPNINLRCIIDNMIAVFSDDNPMELQALVSRMLSFTVDTGTWNRDSHTDLFVGIDDSTLRGLPTGLVAAGFLANVAMLSVDRQVAESVELAQIAHFRYVDDHIVLAQSFDALTTWINEYTRIVQRAQIGVTVNADKTTPKELVAFQSDSSEPNRLLALAACKLDPEYPSPLMTTTLARMSDIARADFVLMGGHEQRNLLSEIEHLLVARVHEDEVRTDTRMAFAATKIARLLPKSRLDPSIWASLSTTVLEMQKALRRIQRDVERLPPDSAEANALAAQIPSLRDTVAAAIAREEEALSQLTEDRDRLANRGLSLLCKSLRDYPDRIRVWERAVDLCAAIAGKHQARLKDTISRVYEGTVNVATGPYLISQMCRWYARALVRCTRDTFDPDTPLEMAEAQRQFVTSMSDSAMLACLLTERPHGAHYLQRSQAILRLSLGVVDLVQRRHSNGQPPLINYDVLKKSGAADWEGGKPLLDALQWDPVACIRWVDQYWCRPMDIEPSPMWVASKKWMSSTMPLAWRWCEPFPRAAPIEIVRRLRRGIVRANPGSQGWFSDADAKHDERLLGPWWLTIASKKASSESDMDDPRVSEWSALEIVKQTAELLRVLPPSNQMPPQPHPLNIRIPKVWKSRPSSWAAWKSQIRAQQLKLVGSRDQISDDRFGVAHPVELADPDWQRLVQLGSLLLYLLRFGEWPARWHAVNDMYARESVMRSVVHEATCSSWTCAILESTLFARARESMMLRAGNLFSMQATFIVADDTVADPPPITDLSGFITAIDVSQRVLEAHQLLMRNSLPKQLVPLRLEQLAGSSWTELGFGTEALS